jgi:hypothetical protein
MSPVNLDCERVGIQPQGKSHDEGQGHRCASDRSDRGTCAERDDWNGCATEALRAAFGDDVVTLWRTGGPRKSHTDEVVCILAEIGGVPRRIVVQSFTSGNFKLFAEIGGKTANVQVANLEALWGEGDDD